MPSPGRALRCTRDHRDLPVFVSACPSRSGSIKPLSDRTTRDDARGQPRPVADGHAPTVGSRRSIAGPARRRPRAAHGGCRRIARDAPLRPRRSARLPSDIPLRTADRGALSTVTSPPSAAPARRDLTRRRCRPSRRVGAGGWPSASSSAGLGIALLSGRRRPPSSRSTRSSKVVEALGQHQAVKIAPKLLAPTSQGAPQTLLLVGNDERPPPKGNPFGSVLPHSNEMLLGAHRPEQADDLDALDPARAQVTFTAPNGEVITNRINSAYTYGSRTAQLMLMVETIKSFFGLSRQPRLRHASRSSGARSTKWGAST